MRSPLAQTVRSARIPAPVGGWNRRDALEAMPATDAVVLDNLIPGAGGVTLRGGYATYASGLGAPVRALLRYSPPSTAPRLFAAAGPKLFDATAGGGVGAPVLSGLVSDRWQGVTFGTPGGSFLVIANGADAPQKFDGGSWSPVAIVEPQPATYAGVAYSYPYNLSTNKLAAPNVYGQRIWFMERGSLRAWYMPVQSIGSSAQIPPAQGGTVPDTSVCIQALDFSSLCRQGGALVAMATWTRDGGTGSDDYAVFVTSAGEVLIFTGTDPDSAAWSLDGVFRIPPPVGEQCLIQAGADIGVLTQTGLLPLSSILPLALSQDETVAITDKIRGAYQDAYHAAPLLFGWQVAEYPKGALLLVNVPSADGTFAQFVLNVLTQAWCSFSGLPAMCFGLLDDRLMFGTPDGRVCQFDVGSVDDQSPIQAIVLPAFSTMGAFDRKRFTRARATYTGAIGYRPALAVAVDNDDTAQPLPQTVVPGSGQPWGSPWGLPWGPRQGSSSRWQTVRGLAQSTASILVSVASLNPFRLEFIDVLFEVGGLP